MAIVQWKHTHLATERAWVRFLSRLSWLVEAEQSVLSRFGHKKRMEKDRLVKKIMGTYVRGMRLRGRPRMGWMDSGKRALNERMSLEQGKMIVRGR